MSYQNFVDLRPVDDLVQLFESTQTPVFPHGTGQSQVGESEIAVDPFAPHLSPPESWISGRLWREIV